MISKVFPFLSWFPIGGETIRADLIAGARTGMSCVFTGLVVLITLLFLYRTMEPRVALLGLFRDGTLRDLQVHPTLPTDDRIIAMRFDGQLYFANVSYFEDTILAAVADHPNAKYVLVIGDGINQLDAAGEEVLHDLIDRLSANDITMALSGLKRQVIQVMKRTSLRELVGRHNIFATEQMALDAIYDRLGEAEKRPLRIPIDTAAPTAT